MAESAKIRQTSPYAEISRLVKVESGRLEAQNIWFEIHKIRPNPNIEARKLGSIIVTIGTSEGLQEQYVLTKRGVLAAAYGVRPLVPHPEKPNRKKAQDYRQIAYNLAHFIRANIEGENNGKDF